MEKSKLHLSIEGENFEEIYSKVQQIRKLINELNYEIFCRNQQIKKLINELNDIELDIELVPNEIKNLEEMAKKIAKKQA